MATSSVVVWLRGVLATGCISWNKLEPRAPRTPATESL